MTVYASSYYSCVRGWEGVRYVRIAPGSNLDGSLPAEAHSKESRYSRAVPRKCRNHQPLQKPFIANVIRITD